MTEIRDSNNQIKTKGRIVISDTADWIDRITVTDCVTGQAIAGSSVSDVLVQISEADLNAWSTLSGSTFDLSPYNGTDQDFDIRFTDTRAEPVYDRQLFTLEIINA